VARLNLFLLVPAAERWCSDADARGWEWKAGEKCDWLEVREGGDWWRRYVGCSEEGELQ
jgi:hypothetical protein